MADAVDAGFSDAERLALSAVLDVVIPPSAERGMPGAGELGLVDAIEAAASANPAMRTALCEGLAALAEHAHTHGEGGFAAASSARRAEWLQAISAQRPEFVANLMFPLITSYYRHPRVLEGLGLEARPPFPKGYTLEPFDESLLASVRRRPKMYRDC